MSRVGLANFALPSGTPNLHDATWREGLNREQWDHIYHAQRVDDPKRKYTYKNAQTEQKEKLSKTWHIMSHVYSSAAGQGSYHYNLHKPVGNVQVYFPSASFSFIPRNARANREELLANSALFENGNNANRGINDHLLSRNHLDNLWASTGNNAHYGGGVWSRSQDPEAYRLQCDRPTDQEALGYNKSLYNETYYNEGHYNSDQFNKHSQRAVQNRYMSSSPEKLRQSWQNLRTRGPHGAQSINARGDSHGLQNTNKSRSGRGAGNNRPASSQHNMSINHRQDQPLGDTNLMMSKTWSGSGGFFRDAHGEKNPHRSDVYDHTVGRFDQIRDNKPTKIYAGRHNKISTTSSPGAGLRNERRPGGFANDAPSGRKNNSGITSTLTDNNVILNSEQYKKDSQNETTQQNINNFNRTRSSVDPNKNFRNRSEDHMFLDVHGDPNVTNAHKRYSHTVSGPFFQPALEEVSTANRLAGGPLTGMVRRNRQHPPRYFMSTQDHSAPRVRRVNQPNAPSFQRVVAV